ncbi:MAG: hypothetical protein WA610_16130, partial [Thermodesulfovibrionales bacterium]
NGRRYQRAAAARAIETGQWHRLSLDLKGSRVSGCIDGEPLISYEAATPYTGYIGLWTKSDSTIWFDGLVIETEGVRRRVEF